jgi:hypothetical protein
MGTSSPSQSYNGVPATQQSPCRASALQHYLCRLLFAPCPCQRLIRPGTTEKTRNPLPPFHVYLHSTRRGSTFSAKVRFSSFTHLLAFHGISKYLEGVMARIDLPPLTFVIIKFLNEFIFEVPHPCRFIGRVDASKSPNEVIMKPFQDNSSVTFTQRERRRSLGELFLVISGWPFDRQLSFTTQIFTRWWVFCLR